jgi:transketolase
MRREFFKLLHEQMKKDKNVYLLVGDLGYGGIDPIKSDTPDQLVNCGASEQSMMDIAVGLAQSGKKVFAYSITPFLLWRSAETIRNYIDHELAPVCLCGSGRGKDYEIDGFSHDASDDADLLRTFHNIDQYWPEDNKGMEIIIKGYLSSPVPTYINLIR